MATKTSPDQHEASERHARETFDFDRYQNPDDLPTADSADEDASIERAKERLNDLPEAQQQRALRRLEDQAARKKDAAGDTPTDEVRDREARPGWVSRVGQPQDKSRKRFGATRKRIKRWAIGSAIVTIFGMVIAASTFIPNKLDVLMQGIEHKFYSRLEHYLEVRSAKLMARYFSRYVFGNGVGISNCAREGKPGFTVRDDCFYRIDPIKNKNVLQSTRIGRAILAWKERKLESTLTPVDISYSPQSLMPDGSRRAAWVVTIPTGERAVVDPNNPSSATAQLFETLDVTDSSRSARSQLYVAIMESLKRETKSSIITRMIASIHLKNKYGLKRCIFYCDLRSRIDQKKIDIRKAWQGFLSERIIGGLNARAGLFMGCMFQGNVGCTEDNKEFRSRYKGMISELQTKLGTQTVEDMLKVAEEYGKYRATGKSFARFLIDKMLEKIGSKLSATGATSIVNAIPIIGQAIFIVIVGYEAFTVILLAYNIYTWMNSDAAQYASTVIKSGVYTASAHTLQVATDESRAADGDVFDIAVRGAESELLNPEKSLLYNNDIGAVAGFNNIASLFARTAYAAEPNEYPILCNEDGTKLEANQLVCPNWRFDQPNRLKQFAEDLPGSAVGEALSRDDVATAIQDISNDVVETVDAPFNAASAAAYETATPDAVKDWLERNMEPVGEAITNYAFSPPFTNVDDIKDAKLYDAAHLGVDWTMNDMLRGDVEEDGSQSGYGGRVASKEEIKRIDAAYEEERRETFAQLSWFDKLFSKENPGSFVSQVALVMPSSFSQLASIFNPSTAFSLAGEAMGGSASAATPLATGAAHGGIPQYVFGNELHKNQLRSETDTKACPNTLAAPNGSIKKIGNSGTTDYRLGRAEMTQSNTCVLDDMMALSNSTYYTNEPLDPAMISASFTSDNDDSGDGAPTGNYAWPIAESDFRATTSCYGNRSGGFHYGLDMVGKRGDGRTEILAADGGTVVKAVPREPSAGGYVAIRHADKEYTLYMHMYPDLRVKVGQKVKKGQVLGRQGNFGESFGSHLHFTYAEGQAFNRAPYAKNPLSVLKNAMPAGSAYRRGNTCPIP